MRLARHLRPAESLLDGQDAVRVDLALELRAERLPRGYQALAFADALRAQTNAVIVSPGSRHWQIFEGLCVAAGAKGDLVPDAYLAALAIESGCEWITTDRDFSRFPGLRWRHPLAGS